MSVHLAPEGGLWVPAPLDKRSLRDQVVGVLRHEILAGVYRPGQRLSEPEVARHLNVSLTPVREALGVLAGAGLVVRRGRQGTYVRRLLVDDVKNLLSVREALEVLAVRQAVPNLTAADRARFAHLLERQAEATDLVRRDAARALPRLVQVNDAFHALILQRTRNEWASSLLASIQDLLGFARARLRAEAGLERRRQSLAEHHEIADALLARDGDRAAAAMSNHIRQLERHVIALASQPDAAVPGPTIGPDRARRRGRRAAAQREQPTDAVVPSAVGDPNTS